MANQQISKQITKWIWLFLLGLILQGCDKKEPFRIVREISGPYVTNCYLVYGEKSREAALIDPGWEIDTLVSFINDNKLDLKYILITHGHTDHYFYVPQLKKMYPQAKWAIHRLDYEKIIKEPNWSGKAYGEKWLEEALKNPETKRYLDFNRDLTGEPDIYIEDGQVFKIGNFELKAIHTPGHSPGGICFYTDDVLFSGDLLFYRSTGKLDDLTSDKEVFIRTVREIYKRFPDSTVVYPGHNQVTTIGEEKKNNKRISEEGGAYDE